MLNVIIPSVVAPLKRHSGEQQLAFSVIKLIVVILGVDMRSVVKFSVVILLVIMPSVVILIVFNLIAWNT